MIVFLDKGTLFFAATSELRLRAAPIREFCKEPAAFSSVLPGDFSVLESESLLLDPEDEEVSEGND